MLCTNETAIVASPYKSEAFAFILMYQIKTQCNRRKKVHNLGCMFMYMFYGNEDSFSLLVTMATLKYLALYVLYSQDNCLCIELGPTLDNPKNADFLSIPILFSFRFKWARFLRDLIALLGTSSSEFLLKIKWLRVFPCDDSECGPKDLRPESKQDTEIHAPFGK